MILMIKYFYLLLSIFLTAYGQLIIKWRLVKINNLPNDLMMKVVFLTKSVLTDFYIFSGFFAAYVASMCWMIAVKNLPLNIAYPLTSLTLILVVSFSTFIFNEKTSLLQMVGMAIIVLGISVVGYSMKIAHA